jgi:signal transduction histidine kinase
VVAATQPLPGRRTLTLEVPESSLTVMADVGLIRRVFRNLLSNALNYTPTGGAVRIVATPAPGVIRVTVTDAGPGIAAEDHQRIFEKFGQVESLDNRTGTGLGLTFCKLAVEAHGGRIGVESEVGTGSTFWLTLPRLDAGGAGLSIPAG